jgi:hypothetical protein
MAFLVANIVYNLTEAAFDRLDLLWFMLLLMIIQYPPQMKRVRGNASISPTAGAHQAPVASNLVSAAVAQKF